MLRNGYEITPTFRAKHASPLLLNATAIHCKINAEVVEFARIQNRIFVNSATPIPAVLQIHSPLLILPLAPELHR